MNPYINSFRLPKFRILFLYSMLAAFLLNALALQHNILIPLLIYVAVIVKAAKFIYYEYYRSRELVKLWIIPHLLVILTLILQMI